jgi:hypothetical protein
MRISEDITDRRTPRSSGRASSASASATSTSFTSELTRVNDDLRQRSPARARRALSRNRKAA